MKRVLSQQIFCSPDIILRNTVIEQNNQNKITNLIDLENQIAETSNTMYYDGIISSEIKSMAINMNQNIIYDLFDYQYVNLRNNIIDSKIIKQSKPLIIDFNSIDIDVINMILKEKKQLLSNLTIYEIIAGCTFYPGLVLDSTKGIKLAEVTRLILWKKINSALDDKTSYFQIYSV